MRTPKWLMVMEKKFCHFYLYLVINWFGKNFESRINNDSAEWIADSGNFIVIPSFILRPIWNDQCSGEDNRLDPNHKISWSEIFNCFFFISCMNWFVKVTIAQICQILCNYKYLRSYLRFLFIVSVKQSQFAKSKKEYATVTIVWDLFFAKKYLRSRIIWNFSHDLAPTLDVSYMILLDETEWFQIHCY